MTDRRGHTGSRASALSAPLGQHRTSGHEVGEEALPRGPRHVRGIALWCSRASPRSPVPGVEVREGLPQPLGPGRRCSPSARGRASGEARRSAPCRHRRGTGRRESAGTRWRAGRRPRRRWRSRWSGRARIVPCNFMVASVIRRLVSSSCSARRRFAVAAGVCLCRFRNDMRCSVNIDRAAIAVLGSLHTSVHRSLGGTHDGSHADTVRSVRFDASQGPRIVGPATASQWTWARSAPG